MVELDAPPVTAPLAALDLGASLPGFTRDPDFQPVPMAAGAGDRGTVIIRGTVDTEASMEALRQRPEVRQVWPDAGVEPFGGSPGPAGPPA